MSKSRIDNLMVDKGLVESQAKAQALLMAGDVLVDGKSVTKAGTMVNEEVEITIAQPPPFVSRGGIKLDFALEYFGIDVASKVIADIGASTGGFTDCLLKRGASRVYAIDVGRGQLDYRLRKDSRVTVIEGQNARYPFKLDEEMDMATIDVSFISVEKIIPAVSQVLKDKSYLLVLVKPQFEAKRKEVGKGGVIKQPSVHARVLGRFINWVTANDYRLKGLVASPISGAAGNREFFVLLGKK